MFVKKWTSAISEESLEKACSYSEKPEYLRTLFGNINLSPKSLEIEYISTGIRKYFDDDKKSRQCLEIKISRNGKEISFPFGMSIYNTETISLRFQRYKYHEMKFFNYEDFSEMHSRIQKDYKEILSSMLYSILCCVRSEFFIPPIFEDFCSDFGYDPDSRKAFSAWQNCLKISQKFQSVFTAKEIEFFPS